MTSRPKERRFEPVPAIVVLISLLVFFGPAGGVFGAAGGSGGEGAGHTSADCEQGDCNHEDGEHGKSGADHAKHGKHGKHGKHSSRLSDEEIPLQTEGFPERPKPLLELGEPFLGTGTLNPGYQLPTGAVWQPSLLVFGTYRTALQTFRRWARTGHRVGQSTRSLRQSSVVG